MHSDLTIISVSYNSGDVFLSNWKNFLDSTRFTVLIVDNDSSDGSGQMLSQSFPDHRVFQAERNIGYGRAANLALKQCRSQFALLLNPDLLVTEEVVVQLLSMAREDNDNTAIWAPATSRVECSAAGPSPVEAVCGAAMLFDLAKMTQVGFFDENIFLYSEETDLCYRTRLAGYLVKLCPGIYLEHLGAGSSANYHSLVYLKGWHFAWSRCYYLDKHALFSKKYNPRRMYQDYRVKSYISLNRINRLRYRAQADGVKAFMRGEKAFDSDGNPRGSVAWDERGTDATSAPQA